MYPRYFIPEISQTSTLVLTAAPDTSTFTVVHPVFALHLVCMLKKGKFIAISQLAAVATELGYACSTANSDSTTTRQMILL